MMNDLLLKLNDIFRRFSCQGVHKGITVTPPPLKKNEFLTEEIHGYATHCSIDVIYVFGEYKQEEKKESLVITC